GGRIELAGETVVQGQLDDADRVDHDPGGVRRGPAPALQLHVTWHVTEGFALDPDVSPLTVGEPRHVVRGADVDVVGRQLVVHDRGERIRLGDRLRLEPL